MVTLLPELAFFDHKMLKFQLVGCDFQHPSLYQQKPYHVRIPVSKSTTQFACLELLINTSIINLALQMNASITRPLQMNKTFPFKDKQA
jgi:hypothetical protein